MKLMAMVLITFYSCVLYAGPSRVGNGDDGTDLEGFDLVTKGKLIETKKEALKLLEKLNTPGVAGLGNLIPELENSKIYLTKKNVSSERLEEMGAFHSGTEGLVYARTFPRSYAATRFFPAALNLSKNQLIALHIHEALHRALPESVREDEKVVTQITLAIISPEQTFDSIESVVKKSIPELSEKPKATQTLEVNKNSKLKSPSSLNLSFSKWGSSSRDNTSSTALPLSHSFNVAAEFYPFGTTNNATGFGISSSYVHPKKTENYFGPLELSVRSLFWTERSYDIELKAGAQLMSSSNSKIIDSVYGRDFLFAGIEAIKVRDQYKLKFGLGVNGPSNYTRTINGQAENYKVGPLIDLSSSAVYIWKEFELGAHLNLLSLSSLKVERAGTQLLNKNRDQYFSAGPQMNYQIYSELGVNLSADYLFNSNNNASEDHIKDLFGNGLGQWKWTLGTEILFF